MSFSKFATIRGLVLPFAAASLFLVASPVAHAQVPQAQTGGTGQNDADQPAPAPSTDQPAADKPADAATPAPAPAPAANGDKPAADAPAADAPATPPPPGTVAPTTGSSTTTTTTKNADGSTSVSTSKTIKLPFHKKAAAKPDNSTASNNTPGKKGKTVSEEKDTSGGAEPDKVLYDRAQDDLKHGRYTEGRLALQTLVNTYPDSEYLAKAKLMVADSYYKEGGTNNLTQAVQEYKDFQTFFPFLENEASYAQMQVGLAHYHMMEKADRDVTQAQQAEDEFQLFLSKYPQSPLVPKAEQYLRDVQEVLADGEFKVAFFYYQTKQDYRASAARLVEMTDRYPLYSNNDQALSMLGDIYDRARSVSKGEDDKNHWADLAAKCYSRILTQYPLSHSAPEAEARLKAMNRPIPAADPEAKAREEQQIAYEHDHHQNAAMRNAMSAVKSNPDTTYASRFGTPQLNPPDDAVSATDVLKSGAQGPSFTVAGGSRKAADASEDSGSVTVEEAAGTGHAEDTSQQQTAVGAEIITPVDDRAQPTSDRSQPNPAPTTTAPPQPQTSTLDNNAAAAGAASPSSVTGAVAGPAAAGATPANSSTESSSSTDASKSAIDGSSTQAPAAGAAATDATPAKPASSDDAQGESTSKKKKGVKKIMPWSKGN